MSRPLRKVVLVDDHEIFRAGLRAGLDRTIQVVGEAGTVEAAVPLIRELEPDVVLLDVHLPDGGGETVVGAVHGERPAVRFLALSVSDAADDVVRRDPRRCPRLRDQVDLAGGPDRRDPPDRRRRRRLLSLARRLRARRLHRRGGRAAAALPMLTAAEIDQLTPREQEVLLLIARGYTYKEIAGRLHLSVKTIESHVSSVLRKLQLSNRNELTRWAAKKRMI